MPDAPVNLVNPGLWLTNADQITFSWEDGESDGEAAITDYRIYYDQTTNTWIELVASHTGQSYTTDFELIEGHTYSFKVQAQNSVGYGDFSDPIAIKAA